MGLLGGHHCLTRCFVGLLTAWDDILILAFLGLLDKDGILDKLCLFQRGVTTTLGCPLPGVLGVPAAVGGLPGLGFWLLPLGLLHLLLLYLPHDLGDGDLLALVGHLGHA